MAAKLRTEISLILSVATRQYTFNLLQFEFFKWLVGAGGGWLMVNRTDVMEFTVAGLKFYSI